MSFEFSINALLKGDRAQLDQLFQAASAPAPAHHLRLTTAETLLANILKEELLDSRFQPALTRLRKGLALRVAADSGFYGSDNHPLRRLLNHLLGLGRTWYSRDTKISQQWFDRLQALINDALTNLTDDNRLEQTLAEFQQWRDSEEKRAAMLESRLCDTESSQLKMLSAECQTLDLIHSNLANKPFPDDSMAGINSVLKSELLHCLLTTGTQHPFWKKWQRLLPLLGQVFSDENTDEQFLYKNIPALLNEIEHSTQLETSNPDYYRQWISHLGDALMRRVQKQPVSCSIFYPLPYPDGYTNLNTRVTGSLLQQAQQLPIGEWLLFRAEDDALIRCKLAWRSEDSDQLLFVDNTGRKVMTKSLKDLSTCMAMGIITPLPAIDINAPLEACLQELLDTALQKHVEQQAQAAAQKQVEALQKRQAEEAAERARLEQIAEAAQQLAEQRQRELEELSKRRAAAQKAMEEARLLAEQKAKRNAEQAATEQAERERLAAEQMAEQMQRLQLANMQISSLNLGARVELALNGEFVTCKLAVIIAASGKYIFVDKVGRKVAELQRDQLLESLLNQQLKLLNNGDNFDDQLAKVIRGLRKDIT